MKIDVLGNRCSESHKSISSENFEMLLKFDKCRRIVWKNQENVKQIKKVLFELQTYNTDEFQFAFYFSFLLAFSLISWSVQCYLPKLFSLCFKSAREFKRNGNIFMREESAWKLKRDEENFISLLVIPKPTSRTENTADLFFIKCIMFNGKVKE